MQPSASKEYTTEVHIIPTIKHQLLQLLWGLAQTLILLWLFQGLFPFILFFVCLGYFFFHMTTFNLKRTQRKANPIKEESTLEKPVSIIFR